MEKVKSFYKCQVNADGDLIAIGDIGDSFRIIQGASGKWMVMADTGTGGEWTTIFSDYSHLNATRYFAKRLAG